MKNFKIEKKLEFLLVILPIKISSYVMDQDPIFENGKQYDLECANLELEKNFKIFDKKPMTTFAANDIVQIPLCE